MLTTWIEASIKGRLGGPVRAGMWSAVVVGTHPIAADQRVWLEVHADETALGLIPGFWVANKDGNNLWHVPIPPQPVNARLRYRAVARQADGPTTMSPFREAVIRPNVPAKADSPAFAISGPEGLVGNRMMTVRIDERGATYDVFFPTVGLHSDVRPAAGDEPQSRTHFRAIVGGLAVGPQLDWFCERPSWDVFQHYQGATNLLITELKSRRGPIRVTITDFVAMETELPRTSGGAVAPGQYFKRFRIHNDGNVPLETVTFGVFIHSEINGGIGEPLLNWRDDDRALVASNRGHGHANRKLARDATVEFALALDDSGPVRCEAVGTNEAMLLRPLTLPPHASVTVDLLVTGAFTGWRSDSGTFEHWLRPALAWFRSSNLDKIEQDSAQAWDDFVEPLPALRCPRSDYPVLLRRAALASALHIDAEWGSVAAGYALGIQAYCWPRDAVWVGGALDRLGHTTIGRQAFEWLNRVRSKDRPYQFWFQKYTLDGWAEWETPAVDQTALIPWGLERYFRRTGDRDFITACWPMIQQAANVCSGQSGHPGLSWVDDLSLVTSAGPWDSRFGAFLYSNACVVAGLRSAARLARDLDLPSLATAWTERAERVWKVGILGRLGRDDRGPGLVDLETGRFLEARRLSNRRELWANGPEDVRDRSAALSIGLLGPVVPFGLMAASDPIAQTTAEAILEHNALAAEPNALARWGPDPDDGKACLQPWGVSQYRRSSLAGLWMARYLIQLGRETGEPTAWARALSLLDDIIGRLLPLGLGLRRGEARLEEPSASWYELPGVRDLHAMLIETILDLAGLDYDVPARTVILDPVLPPGWPVIGLEHRFQCGKVGYRLERPVATKGHRLTLEADLNESVTLQIGVTCPGLTDPGAWHTRPLTPLPRFDRSSCRMSWSVPLPIGASTWEWSWG